MNRVFLLFYLCLISAPGNALLLLCCDVVAALSEFAPHTVRSKTEKAIPLSKSRDAKADERQQMDAVR